MIRKFGYYRISIFFFSVILLSSSGRASELLESITGLAGSVVIHESGHALTAKWLGADIEAFSPYPQKVRYIKNNGSYEDTWVLGLVKIKAFTDVDSARKEAWVSAMGSGMNLLSVLVAAPLLPSISSPFVKNAYDNMLFFSCFDWPSYVIGDLVTHSKTGDWNKVSKLSGVSIYWYLTASIASSLVINQYRYYWHKRAAKPEHIDDGPLTVGFSTTY
jgi:hypothetical protein